MNDNKRKAWQKILRFGLLGGVVGFYFCIIGMVETFSLRNLIGDFLSLGDVLLAGGALGAGYLTAREFSDKSNGNRIISSMGAGLVASIPLLFLVIIQLSIPGVRNMFINISPGLTSILTFGLGPGLGNIVFMAYYSILSGLAAAYTLLPIRLGRSVLASIVVALGIGLFSENVSQIIQQVFGVFGQFFGRAIVRLLFQQKALNPIAALVIAVLTFLIAYFGFIGKARTRYYELPDQQQGRGRSIILLVVIAFLIIWPWMAGIFLSQVSFTVGYYVMLGLGLNIVVGYAGLLDLGYVAFFAFGAYIMGVLTSTGPLGQGFTFWTALPLCMLVGVLWGVLLGFPVLRMRGDYLAIVTLGFGEIIRILALSDWLAPIEGGAQGVLHIPNPVIFGVQLNTPQTMYYLVVLGSLLAAFVTIRLRESRLGRQWMAMREDEDVAEAMGINLVSTKLLAFAIGAAFSALAGGIFASKFGTIFPHSFNLLISINALAVIIVGGLGSIPGVVVGALILVGLPELLREFTEYRLLMYGVLLIIMMLVKPEGFIPEPTRKRELLTREEEYAD
jgi:branched-chain amino acid transport system permease protein